MTGVLAGAASSGDEGKDDERIGLWQGQSCGKVACVPNAVHGHCWMRSPSALDARGGV